ncbi:MAG: MFS transporter [Candidatus Tectimicrobiota bacterium]
MWVRRTPPSGWRQWIEVWYIAYGILGAVMGGLIPIVLPLAVHRSSGAAYTGLVMAALNLGGMTAPLWGHLADRYRLHRWLLAGGLAVLTVAVLVLALASQPVVWLGLALVQGMGSAAAATVANLFVVEVHPEAEWDKRLGWLQTFYSGGQVGGLLLAGLVTQGYFQSGVLVAAGCTTLAMALSWLTTPVPPQVALPRPLVQPSGGDIEWPHGALHRLWHHPPYRTLGAVWQRLHSAFALFLCAWLIAFTGSSSFFALYPVLMDQLYGVTPALASSSSALAHVLSLTLFAPAGRWSAARGPLWVLRAAFTVRTVAFCGLLGLHCWQETARSWLALGCLGLLVLSWALLSVSGTAMTARLAQQREGEGIGLFNATSALAGVLGAALGGWIASNRGFEAVLVLAVLGVTLGNILTRVFHAGAPARLEKESA